MLPQKRIDLTVIRPNIDEAIASITEERLQEPWPALSDDFMTLMTSKIMLRECGDDQEYSSDRKISLCWEH
jgi:hypothetical protein